jgi:uncharacterized protein (TIGR03083 family)
MCGGTRVGTVGRMTLPPVTTPGIWLGTMVLQTHAPCDFDPEHLLDVYAAQRQWFISVLRGFGPGDWAAPTRCAGWSAHDVVRHLADCAAIGAATTPGDGTLDVGGGFDPRTSPLEWLAASDGETPAATLGRLAAATDDMLSVSRDRVRAGRRFDVQLPFGPMDWTVRMLHSFWDSWIHERDVLLARGARHVSDRDATAYAVGYGVFIAAAVAQMFGDPVQATLRLGGDGGGVFDVQSRDGVALTVDCLATAGPPAAEVADALAGRSPAAAAGDVPAGLFRMAELFNTPV